MPQNHPSTMMIYPKFPGNSVHHSDKHNILIASNNLYQRTLIIIEHTILIKNFPAMMVKSKHVLRFFRNERNFLPMKQLIFTSHSQLYCLGHMRGRWDLKMKQLKNKVDRKCTIQESELRLRCFSDNILMKKRKSVVVDLIRKNFLI